MAKDMLSYINNASVTPHLLPFNFDQEKPFHYYWWQSGNMWDAILEYGHLTGDITFRSNATEALLEQKGEINDFRPSNWTLSEGWDDQGTWAMAAMTAAERGVPNVKDQPRWVDLARAAFNEQLRAFNEEEKAGTCGGGLRWQIYKANAGYDYKNSASNGALFNLAARLYRFTGSSNTTYSDTANRVWDWMTKVGLLDAKSYNIYDGAHVQENCSVVQKPQFSQNTALFLLGAAHMHNSTTGSDLLKWDDRVKNLVDMSVKFFAPKDNILVERACEEAHTCASDHHAYKGILLRAYGQAEQVAPFIANQIAPVFKATAKAALHSCTLGDNARQCGFEWFNNQEFDDLIVNIGFASKTVTANMEGSALSAVLALLAKDATAPYTGANSPNKGDDKEPSADGTTKDDKAKDGSSGKDGKDGKNAGGRVQASVAAAAALALLAM